MTKIEKLWGQDWVTSEYDRTILDLLYTDGYRHVNAIEFNLTSIDRKSLMIGHGAAQSNHMITCRKIAADKKNHIFLTTYEEILKDCKDFIEIYNHIFMGFALKFINLGDAKIQHAILWHRFQNRSGYPVL